MSSRFKPSKRSNLIDPIKTERLRRTIRSYNQIDREYVPDRKGDKQELECSLYKQKYPDNILRELKTVLRVKVPRGSFELDEDGTVDTEGKVTEALVYTVIEKVVNPNPDPEKGETEYFSWCSTKHGVYKKPTAIVKRDDLGNTVSSRVTGARAMFWIPFNEKNVRKVLEEFQYEYRNLALAIAENKSADSWYGSHTYRVY
ncbi:MAG: hypothetical protein ACRD8W_15460, partial [Nitrososphaeraceae archaeon]